MIAGPSEVLILADAANDPDWLALDLLAQAEHDASAQAILVTDDAGFGRAVAAAVEAPPRHARTAAPSPARAGAISAPSSPSSSWDEAVAARRPHRPRAPAGLHRRRRGAGRARPPRRRDLPRRLTPEAIGDYVGGPNHVLPTARSARFSSGLSVLDFMKRTTIARMTPAALAAIGPAAERLARVRGPRGARPLDPRPARPAERGMSDDRGTAPATA